MKEVQNLKIKYRNKKEGESIGQDFLRPCLKNFTSWRRCTLGFSTNALKTWAGSFIHIIQEVEKIEILCDIGSVSDKTLLKTLEHCSTEEEKNKTLLIHNENILLTALGADASIDNQEDFRNKYGWKLLHYLIASDKLIIRFAMNKISEEYSHLYHEKMGYFVFPNGARVAHEGSFNESESGHKNNNESVQVFSSYREGDDERRILTEKDVDDDWKGNDSVKTYPLSKKTLEIIKKTAPKTKPIKVQEEEEEEKDTISVSLGPPPFRGKKLRLYQENAIDKWFFKCGKKGILEHATGSGKTFTALHIIKKMFEDTNPIVVIGVPYKLLAHQWSNECTKFFDEFGISYNIIECWSENKSWRLDFEQQLLKRKYEKSQNEKSLSIFVVVNKTLNYAFKEKINLHEEFDLGEALFIGDECHNYSSSLPSSNLPEFAFRLGLSATPVNDEDSLREGDELMLDYFGGSIDTYTLKNALEDPEGPFLVKYDYFPILCDMSEKDFDQWHKLYKKSGWGNEDATNDKARQAIFRKMNSILSSLDSKYSKLKELTSANYKKRQHSLIFCGEGSGEGKEKNIDLANNILNKNNWVYSSIISAEKQTQEDRINIIQNFVNKKIDSICAIKILDEGIDVPAIQTAYILASSKSRRQFVQRRGRVLRLSKETNKKKAEIYDFIVNPPLSRLTETGIQKIFENEIIRMEEMGMDAENKDDVKKFIKNYKK